mmetsp:Transcript_50482/g.130110  ORF Transcript_50482/g.130110 Transcript_50482/m.130110 type:complete len:160 (+) Transcript_50482:1842-2321(+)
MQLVLSTSSFQHAIYEHIASFNFATLRKSEIEGGGEEEKRNMLKLKTCGEVHGERKHVTVTRWLQNWIDAGVQNRVGSAGTCMQRGEKIGKLMGGWEVHCPQCILSFPGCQALIRITVPASFNNGPQLWTGMRRNGRPERRLTAVLSCCSYHDPKRPRT